MQLIVPFAALSSEYGRQAIHDLDLPRLRIWLRGAEPDGGSAPGPAALNMPHDFTLAAALGWPADPDHDGRLGLAAWHASRAGLKISGTGCARLTPVHLSAGREMVSLAGPASIGLSEREADDLRASLQPLFVDAGFELQAAAANSWIATHPLLAELRGASLDRVEGRAVEPWITRQPPLLARLMTEVQMVLHGHPLNEAREARGQSPVNSLWLSDSGPIRPVDARSRVDDRLRAPAIAGDWVAWREAWRELDASISPGEIDSLILGGDSASTRWVRRSAGWLARLRRMARGNDPAALLESL